jgi:hypothetical protein
LVENRFKDTLRLALQTMNGKERNIKKRKNSNRLVKHFSSSRPSFAAGFWPTVVALDDSISCMETDGCVSQDSSHEMHNLEHAIVGEMQKIASRTDHVLEKDSTSRPRGHLDDDEKALTLRIAETVSTVLKSFEHGNQSLLKRKIISEGDLDMEPSASASPLGGFLPNSSNMNVIRGTLLWDSALDIGLSSRVVSNAKKRMAFLDVANLISKESNEINSD